MKPSVAEVRGYRAMVTRQHDGDSFWVLADLGYSCRAEPELRLLDVHAPELDRMALPRIGQPGGDETREYINGWLAAAQNAAAPRRWYLWVQTVPTRTIEPTEKQTFTRYLATVWRIVDCPIWGQGGDWNFSLNYQVNLFLSGHPDWPPGE
jgi:hypothetical protein